MHNLLTVIGVLNDGSLRISAKADEYKSYPSILSSVIFNWRAPKICVKIDLGLFASILYGVSPSLFGLYKYLEFFGFERINSVISRLLFLSDMCSTLSPCLSTGLT